MNDDRAKWANAAVSVFATLTNMRDAGESDHTILADLLADLRHWADRNGVDWSGATRDANAYYADETTCRPAPAGPR